jgi:alkanesulfonate monooxygenase SsuD/methylene tetrahydromethanopterin reductase-like flavin-dependent oxidoreductase (luciferase family)
MSYGTIEEKVRLAEGLGFHSVWFMDHLAPPAQLDADTFEAMTLVAALAARTTKIRLGHLVLNGLLRHPAQLAKEAATIDVISGGRLELGLGWGSVPQELTTYGYRRDTPVERVRRLVETIEIVRLMLSGETFSYRGTHHQLHDAIGRPRPVQQPLPIHVGGADRRLTIPLARKYADWWNCPSYAADQLETLIPGVGDTKVSVQHVIGLAPVRSQKAVVEDEAKRRFGSWGGLVCGTAPEVAATLAREAAMGVDLFILQFSDFATPRTLKLFSREVVPVVRQALGGSGRPRHGFRTDDGD